MFFFRFLRFYFIKKSLILVYTRCVCISFFCTFIYPILKKNSLLLIWFHQFCIFWHQSVLIDSIRTVLKYMNICIYFETRLPEFVGSEWNIAIDPQFILTCLPRPSDQMPTDFSTRIRRVPQYYATEFNERRERRCGLYRASDCTARAFTCTYTQLPDINTTYVVSLS